MAKEHPLTAQIHALRARGLTQAAIGQALGIHSAKVSRILNIERHRANERESHSRYRKRNYTALADLAPQSYAEWIKEQSKS